MGADSDSDEDLDEDVKAADFDYLLGMAMWSLTQRKSMICSRRRETNTRNSNCSKKNLPQCSGTTTWTNFWKNCRKLKTKRLQIKPSLNLQKVPRARKRLSSRKQWPLPVAFASPSRSLMSYERRWWLQWLPKIAKPAKITR